MVSKYKSVESGVGCPIEPASLLSIPPEHSCPIGVEDDSAGVDDDCDYVLCPKVSDTVGSNEVPAVHSNPGGHFEVAPLEVACCNLCCHTKNDTTDKASSCDSFSSHGTVDA